MSDRPGTHGNDCIRMRQLSVDDDISKNSSDEVPLASFVQPRETCEKKPDVYVYCKDPKRASLNMI